MGFRNELRRFYGAVKTANPDALILAEHYGNPEGWLQGDQWDSVMNYDAFMEPVTWFLTGMEKHSDEYREDLYGDSGAFIGAMMQHMRSLHMSALHTAMREDLYGDSGAFIGAMMQHMRSLHMSALHTAMNELSNHDHSRFLTRTNRRVGRISYAGAQAASENVSKAVMREAVVIQMTWPGAPTLYYGDEAGVCGFTDPDNRRTYPWGQEDQDLILFHKKMIAIHKKYRILRSGSLKFLWNDYQGLCYGRFSHTEQIIVVINNREEGREVTLDIWQTGITRLEETVITRLMLTTQDGFTDEEIQITSRAGCITLYLPPKSAMVLHHKDIR